MKIYGLESSEAKKLVLNGEVTIAIYGLGKMGLPLSAIFASKGANVIGIDINPKVVETVNKGVSHVREEPGLNELVKKAVESGRLKATTELVEAVKQADVIIILVPTLLTKFKKPDLSAVETAMKSTAQGLQKGTIVITECTMPPGSTESFIPLLESGSGLKCGKDFGLAHCPERSMSGTALRDIEGEYVKIVGAINNDTIEPLKGFYEAINSKGVYPVSSIKTAETVKVFEGVYRDVNIAVANEFAIVAQKLGIDTMETIKAANTQPYSHIHTPGCGVGGHCIPVYPLFIIDEDTPLIETARHVNDHMPHYLVDLFVEAVSEAKKPLKGLNVMVFGLTYRGGVKEFIKTPAEVVVKSLQKLHCNVFAFDPLCSEDDAKRFDVILDNKLHSLEKMDAIVITSDHVEFVELDWEKVVGRLRTKIVVDGRQMVEPSEIKKFKAIYRGIGRI